VSASRKKSFHISLKSRNAKLKLCNLYQFAEAFNGITSCKVFCPSFTFHHFVINCICLILSLPEPKEVLVVVKQFTSSWSIETFLSSRYYSHGSSFSLSVVCKLRNVVKAFKFSKKVVHLACYATQDLYNTDTSDMNKPQSWSLPSLSFLSADLTCLDMYIWLVLLTACLHSDETR